MLGRSAFDCGGFILYCRPAESRPAPATPSRAPAISEEPDLLSFFDPTAVPTRDGAMECKADDPPVPPSLAAEVSCSDDEALARMIADELYQDEMMSDPEFLEYLRAGTACLNELSRCTRASC